MSESESNEPCAVLTSQLEKRFSGHPYRWDYSTKCLFLMLDIVSSTLLKRRTVSQELIVRYSGMRFLGSTEASDILRAIKISAQRTFGLEFFARGNGGEREYWLESRDTVLCIRRFLNRRIISAKLWYVTRCLDEALAENLEETR
jgi:hypothetical protein